MKKILLITIISTLMLTACSSSIYVYKFSPTPGIDFRKGKWLLNDIAAPDIIKPVLTDISVDAFSKYLKDNLFILNKTDGLILPPIIPINPSKSILKDIKNGTSFDYFINVQAKSLKNDIGAISFSAPINPQDENRAEVTLEVYDLNKLEIVYSQTVTGVSQIDNDGGGFMLTKGINSLMIGALNKIFRKIRKNHR